jgi:hypothetical protein
VADPNGGEALCLALMAGWGGSSGVQPSRPLAELDARQKRPQRAGDARRRVARLGALIPYETALVYARPRTAKEDNYARRLAGTPAG